MSTNPPADTNIVVIATTVGAGVGIVLVLMFVIIIVLFVYILVNAKKKGRTNIQVNSGDTLDLKTGMNILLHFCKFIRQISVCALSSLNSSCHKF